MKIIYISIKTNLISILQNDTLFVKSYTLETLILLLTTLIPLAKIIRKECKIERYIMRVSKSLVIETASKIADKQGLNNLSLKAVAEELNVRTPSLYNHIESLDDLLREVAHKGMRSMNEQMTQAAIGKSGNTALKSISVEYLNFIIEHPGVYETIQWATWHGTNETAEIFENYIKILSTIILSYSFPSESTNEILNLFTGFLHGFTTLQVRYAFSEPQKVRDELCNSVDTIMLGVFQKYGGHIGNK
mgnify:CR=1 FL=1